MTCFIHETHLPCYLLLPNERICPRRICPLMAHTVLLACPWSSTGALRLPALPTPLPGKHKEGPHASRRSCFPATPFVGCRDCELPGEAALNGGGGEGCHRLVDVEPPRRRWLELQRVVVRRAQDASAGSKFHRSWAQAKRDLSTRRCCAPDMATWSSLRLVAGPAFAASCAAAASQAMSAKLAPEDTPPALPKQVTTRATPG